MVRLFDFKSDKHFVASSDKTTLKVYELSNPSIYPSYIRKAHWKEVGNIIPRDHDDSDEGTNESLSYDGLMFFDGQAEIKGREAQTKLAQHLARLRLMVSPQGHCFQDVTELGEHKDFGIHYLRLNDRFNWPFHGVSMAGLTTWPRCLLKYTMPSREKQHATTATTGGVSKEKYEELKRTVKKKEEDMEKLREEMEEQDEELQKLKEEMEGASEKHEAELRELETKKDEELRRLTKKKNDELDMLRKEKAEHDELEQQRRKQSWAITATTRYFSNDTILKSRRQPVPLDTWTGLLRRTPYFSHWDTTFKYEPYAIGASTWFPTTMVQLVDEEPRDWKPPPKIYLFSSGFGAFDTQNWWFVKTTHPDGGVTMIAYYDGNRTWFDGLGYPTPLPVARTHRFDTNTPFFFVYVVDRYKLAFMYRD
ncbi:unnamed protein product [Linum tenue]|uniref:Uncharacterized protein n=1 Tax=Linum tenue TaxID=586396 RepID=A0AAV0L2X4_9ROSI|nr:unnamed protein product [Linum tenue]